MSKTLTHSYASDGELFHIVSNYNVEFQVGFCGEQFKAVALGKNEQLTTSRPVTKHVCLECEDVAKRVAKDLSEMCK